MSVYRVTKGNEFWWGHYYTREELNLMFERFCEVAPFHLFSDFVGINYPKTPTQTARMEALLSPHYYALTKAALAK